MPKVNGILETALSVADVDKSAAFYRRVFNLGTLLESERLIALNVAGRNVLLLFKSGATEQPYETPGGVIPGHGMQGRSHFAFSIAAEDIPAWKTHLESAGIKVESVVKWPTGPVSIYFRDLDSHLVELITTGFWRFENPVK